MKSIIVFIFLLTFLSASTQACDCIPDDTIAHAYNNADLIFVGKVIERDTVLISDSANVSTESNPKFHLEVTIRKFIQTKFLITKQLKGKEQDKIVIIMTGAVGTRCGFDFSLNSNYVVYAYKEKFSLINHKHRMTTINELRYSTSSCTRTTPTFKYEIKTLIENKLI